MSSSADDSKSTPATGNGPVLLPPPVAPAKSVLRSIHALDAAESGHAAPEPQGKAMSRPHGAPTIDAFANETPAASPAPQADGPRKSAEPVQPLRANAFRPNAPEAQQKPARKSGWLLRAAAVLVLTGGGWVIAAQVTSGQWSLTSPQGMAAAKISPIDQLREDIRVMSGELTAMRAQMASLDSPDARARQTGEIEAIKRSLADIARRVEQGRTAQTSAVSEIGARLERSRLDEAKQREEIGDRIARLERQLSDGRPTATQASVQAPNSTVVPRVAITPPSPAGEQATATRKPAAFTGYVLREVYNGVALIEGRSGFLEVFPGAMIPGAGRVQSIVRRSGQWVVVTTGGVIGPQVH